MKKTIFLLSIISLFLSSCSEGVSESITYKINEPVFMSTQDFRNSLKVTKNTVEITDYGKIAFYNGYLYICESGKGIHIIDNRVPSSPANVGFIELLGNADLAIRNNLLYADSYIDLVWFDVTNPAQPTFKGRLENIFPKALPIIENEFGIDYALCYPENANQGVVVGWQLKERTEPINEYTGGWFWRWGGPTFDGVATTNTAGSSSNGINGSMSRFTLYNNNLYTVTENQMTIFDLTGEMPKKAAESIYIGWNVETIFSYKDNMFMGTPTGMLIYSVTDPLKPIFQSSVSHVFGCDPVVVDNDLAYVTVHSGNNCGQNANDLFIVDVKDVKKPKQVATFAMTSPKGLGIDDGKLFLCDNGLKIFTITSPTELYLKSLKNIEGMLGYDLIAYNNTLMMIAEDGLYQYNYANINDIKFLSKLAFAKKAN